MDLAAVHAALAGKSYSAVAPLCDDLFLQAASRGAATDDWPYAVHLLAHLYLNDLYAAICSPLPSDFWTRASGINGVCVFWVYGCLCVSRNSARFLWKSTPQEAKDARPELAAVWKIGQCLWNRDYAGVYTAAQGFEWSPEIADFVAAFLESYRKRIFQLLTSAYSTISVAYVAHFMGMNEEDATNYAMQNGWSLDAAAKMLTVVKPKVKTNQKLDASKLQRLTECVFHLEH
uniref:COP9 signalosome complex subunit 8 n=1 Tax=Oryza punctata TaxID=4537 RepID=A0A0E0KQM9_ORYPU